MDKNGSTRATFIGDDEEKSGAKNVDLVVVDNRAMVNK